MTVNEFIEKLNTLEVSGDERLVISCFGGLSCNENAVREVSIGFDWHRGAILIHPQHAVAYYRPQTESTNTAKPTKKRGKK